MHGDLFRNGISVLSYHILGSVREIIKDKSILINTSTPLKSVIK